MIDRPRHLRLLVPSTRLVRGERSNSFSTESFHSRDKYDAWREWFRPGFEVQPSDGENRGFIAHYAAWQVGDLVMTSMAAPPVHSVRLAIHLRRGPVDHWVITYCRDSTTRLETKRWELEARGGVPFLWSLGQPSRHISMPCSTQRMAVGLCLPRDSFPDMAAQLDSAVGTMLVTPIGRLLGDFLVSLVRELPAIADSEIPAVEAAPRSLVTCLIRPPADTPAEAHSWIALYQLEQVRRVVQSNLRSPNLEVNMLCRKVAMSRSALYRLLELRGGVARFGGLLEREYLTALRIDPRRPRRQHPS